MSEKLLSDNEELRLRRLLGIKPPFPPRLTEVDRLRDEAALSIDALLAWCVRRGWSVAIDGPYPCWDVHIYASPGHHFVGKSLAWKQSYDLEGGAGTAFARAVLAAAEAAE